MTTSDATPFGAATTAKYVLLTTFRKDGTPVAAPLWAAVEGPEMLMWTNTDSWKVRRLRRDPRVIVQACDVRGKRLIGDPVRGTGQVLEGAGADRARSAIARRYGIIGWLLVKGSLLRRGKAGNVGIAISADPTS